MKANNVKAMCEALERLLNLAYEVQDLNSEDGPKTSVPAQFVIDVAKSALCAPPRNCDVGAAQEQEVRFEAFCHAHRSRERCCEDCPIVADRASCELAWAQMPYEEGGAK